MNLLLLWIAPTILIFLGLQVASSVPLTFLLFYGWLLLVPWILSARGNREERGGMGTSVSALGLVWKRKDIALGIVTGLLFGGSIVLGGYFLHSVVFDAAALQEVLDEWKFSGDLVLWLSLVLVLINPVLEELYWRGFVFARMKGAFAARKAILLTAVWYSMYHFLTVIPLFSWPYNVFLVLPVFGAGLVWGYMRMKNHSIVGAIISHTLADSGIMAVYLLFVRS